MVVYATQEVIGGKSVFEVNCERCGDVIGILSGDEVLAVSTGKYGQLLCPKCDDSACPACKQALVGRDEEYMQNFGVCWFCYCDGRVPEIDQQLDCQIGVGFTEKAIALLESLGVRC